MAMSFRSFLRELVELDPANNTRKLADELGIDMTKAKGPQWASNVTLGNLTYNGLMYRYEYMKDSSGNVTGVRMKPLDSGSTERAYYKGKDGMVRLPKPHDGTYDDGGWTFVPLDRFHSIRNQPDISQVQQQAAFGGGGGGMPL